MVPKDVFLKLEINLVAWNRIKKKKAEKQQTAFSSLVAISLYEKLFYNKKFLKFSF